MTQLEKLKLRIPYDEDIFQDNTTYEQVLNDLLEDSKNMCLSILYPFQDITNMSLPSRYENWQLRACVELFNLADKQGIINYTENGISWDKKSDGLSVSLMNELTSRVGVPKKVESDEQDV